MRFALFSLLVLFLITGCSQKSYYKPKKIEGSLASSHLFSAVTQSSDGWYTAENGDVFTHTGHYKLSSGEEMVGLWERGILIADQQGNLKITDGNASSQVNLGFPVVVAARQGERLAVLTAQNRLIVYDLATASVLIEQAFGKAIAVDDRIAPPLFVGDVVIVGTLDGKVAVIELASKRVVRDIVVKHMPNLSNIIFLGTVGGRLIAATTSRIVAIDASSVQSYDASIRLVKTDGAHIYLGGRDGTLQKLTPALALEDSVKLPFAHYMDMRIDKGIWAVEKRGYLVHFDEVNLSSIKVYQLGREIDGISLFWDDRLLAAGSAYTLP